MDQMNKTITVVFKITEYVGLGYSKGIGSSSNQNCSLGLRHTIVVFWSHGTVKNQHATKYIKIMQQEARLNNLE